MKTADIIAAVARQLAQSDARPWSKDAAKAARARYQIAREFSKAIHKQQRKAVHKQQRKAKAEQE